jgi:hypothetical protein
MKSQGGVLFSVLWHSQISDHTQEDLAKIGYKRVKEN